MVSSRLYLNKGNMQFEDITESAGVKTTRWVTGASMVDLTGNGYMDIYVSVSGMEKTPVKDRANLLFINNGNGSFTESAEQYNLADTGFTTHAVFLDYNGNGYLDVFLLNNSPEDFARGNVSTRPSHTGTGSTMSFDKLYRNNGDGTFTDVSREAGIIKELGYGLGVVVTDINRNGWPDIYISNDSHPDDVLYINNRDGTFTNMAHNWLKHTSFAGMGVDIADFNNDGWPDILQVDMMPEALSDRKRMSGSTSHAYYQDMTQRGYNYKYSINTLQLSRGLTNNNDVMFSELARMSGVAYTDWSWSALFADFDNDGQKDILITNGFPKAANDYDFYTTSHNLRSSGNTSRLYQILDELHSIQIPNYIFRNEGIQPGNGHSLAFTNKNRDWGLDEPALSYGAVYVDLNNNGRLDLVINNINAPAFIYENLGTGVDERQNNYLKVQLKGEYPNRQGIGSEVILTAGGQKQYIYHTSWRGYKSTVDDRIHFGLSQTPVIDSLEVFWPDGRYQLLTGLKSNQIITVQQNEALQPEEHINTINPETLRIFKSIEPSKGLNYRHQSDQYTIDYNVQPLLPYMISRQGPALAVSDVTGSGLDDVYIGGGAGFEGRLFIQQSDGTFIESADLQPFAADKEYDDWGALFFDANGNGLPDLYVASGGYQSSPASDLLQDRLYINQGNGRFVKDSRALPEVRTSTSSVKAGDFTGDGQLDLFVGGRLTPRNYPFPARSYILRNEGGNFTDVTVLAAPGLINPGGMITDAVWMDFTGNGHLDLVTAGEWMSLQFFENTGGQFRNVTDSMKLPAMNGWWFSLEAGDFNNNGHLDLIAGNLGLNHIYTTSNEGKLGLYASDFSKNGTTDIVFTMETEGNKYPVLGLAVLGRAIYTVGLKFPTFESFSNASIEQIFDSASLNEALYYQADTFSSMYLQNNGDGTFTTRELPRIAQISPIKSIIAHDFDDDGNLDLLIAGNIYHTEPNTPRADAGKGLWLKGDGEGNFAPVPPMYSGFTAPLDVRNLSLITTTSGKAVLVASNNDSLQTFSIIDSTDIQVLSKQEYESY
jgi:enediyne biosynthesis protein E4